ncbi:MAG: glucuronyl hydrolase [Verrucomicrobiales bacterium]|nr:glucuronyl hydrolase [Verrucomicrobiales bacterium]
MQISRWLLICTLLTTFLGLPARSAEKAKPVLLYSRYFNAEGEDRYQPDGTFKSILDQIKPQLDVVVHNKPLTPENLKGVNLVLIANPSDKAVKEGPAPHHFSPVDIKNLTTFVQKGGGLIIMGNQENHNLEVEDTNKLLKNFGLQFTNLYTDAKKLIIAKDVPVLGGLTWAYYTGNLVEIEKGHPAHPRALVNNDLDQKPAKGMRDQPGALLAVSEPGKGRVAVITDAGWLTETALDGRGIGGVAIKDHDNLQIFLLLASWLTRNPR